LRETLYPGFSRNPSFPLQRPGVSPTLRVIVGVLCSLVILIALATAAHSILAVSLFGNLGSAPTPVAEGTSAFVQSFGINTHLGYPGTPYYDQAQRVISALQYLGIETIRDQSPAYNSDPLEATADSTVAAAGVRFDAVVPGNGPVNLAESLANMASFARANPGALAAVEGPNEINDEHITYAGLTDSYSAGVQVTRDLWTAVQSNTALKAVPVYALTLSIGIPGAVAGATELGNLSPFVTYGNVHVYACCSNNVWQKDMPYWLPVFEQATASKPTVVTETGYATMPGNVDEISAAKYNLNTFCENAFHGIAKTYLYELVDMNSSAMDAKVDDHLGEFHDDWTPKPGATAIHNLSTILQSAGSGLPSGPLNYSVRGLPSTGHTFLLGSDTSFDIAVWIDATVYDPKRDADIAAPAYSASVDLGATFSSIRVYDPLVGTAPIAAYSNLSKVKITVIDHPVIVQVK
jgi:trimeric autotransporter adhesin